MSKSPAKTAAAQANGAGRVVFWACRLRNNPAY
jgi:hypothetical protein